MGATPLGGNAQVETWLQELATTGRIEIRHSSKNYLIQFGFPIAIVIAFFLIGSLGGELSRMETVFGTVIVPLLIMGIATFFFRKNRGKALVIEQGGLTMQNGHHLSWGDISSADVFRSSRSGPAVRLVVSDRGWAEFMQRQSLPGRWLNQFNAAVTRKHGIYLPQQLGANPDDLATVINMFATDSSNT